MSSDGVRHLPTMTDVAHLAGVSHQTVSRVLSNHPNVRESTRAKVYGAVDALRYRRNSSARALAMRRTLTLGAVVCNPTHFGPSSMMSGLEDAARDGGYRLSAVHLRRHSAEALKEAIQSLSDWGVEGIVVIVPHRPAVSALAEVKLPFPVVTVDGGRSLPTAGVSTDQELGARLVTGHLLAAGHRTVWQVAGPADWLEAGARIDGWRAALEEAGAMVPPTLVGDWTALSGYHAGQELAGRIAGVSSYHRALPVSAVFAASDQMALGVLRAFREAGLSVPNDVAIAGFDDIPEAEFFAPPLTTVRQDFAAVGQASIRLLIDQLESGTDRSDEHITIEPRLIVRRSSIPT